jgi:hypothetical protein
MSCGIEKHQIQLTIKAKQRLIVERLNDPPQFIHL